MRIEIVRDRPERSRIGNHEWVDTYLVAELLLERARHQVEPRTIADAVDGSTGMEKRAERT